MPYIKLAAKVVRISSEDVPKYPPVRNWFRKRKKMIFPSKIKRKGYAIRREGSCVILKKIL